MAEKKPYTHPDGRTCTWDADDNARYPLGSDVRCDRNHP